MKSTVEWVSEKLFFEICKSINRSCRDEHENIRTFQRRKKLMCLDVFGITFNVFLFFLIYLVLNRAKRIRVFKIQATWLLKKHIFSAF